MKDFPISQITIGSRFREDVGDIDELAASIDEHGLLQPIVINDTGGLIAGKRRIFAVKKLGWRSIPVRIISPENPKLAEIDENTKRKDFTYSEIAAIADYVESTRIGHRPQKGSESGPFGHGKTDDILERIVGKSHDTISKIRRIAQAVKENPKEFGDELKKLDQKETRVHSSYNKIVNAERKKTSRTPKLPDGVYNILYVDPPWEFENQNTGGSLVSGAAQKYPTMSIDELESFGEKLQTSIAKDAVCFMWATVPLLPESISLLESWGFEYKTALFWHKKDFNGLGFWFRGTVEMLLLGVRGHVPAFRCQYSNHIETKPAQHSEKPEEMRQLIEEAIKGMRPQKKIELFARRESTAWKAWGNQLA